MSKTLIFNEEARKKVLDGVTTIAKAVKSTLGPAGRNVVIEKTHGAPVITKDGVTVAKEVHLHDQFENIGAQLIREVASKTNDVVGDGTSGSTVLAEAIFKDGMKHVTAGANPVYLSRGINTAATIIAEKLKDISIPVQSNEEIYSVATVSANWDAEIGKVIADAMAAVGTEGTVTVEEGSGTATNMTVSAGMQFERGYLSPLFMEDSNATEVVLEDPVILTYDKKLTTLRSCIELLTMVQQAQRPLLVISESVEGEALSTMVLNHMRGALRCCAVMAPGFGDRRKAMLKDIAIMTGGTYVAEELGVNLNELTMEDLGSARKVVITKDNTTIIDGAGDQEAISKRADAIRREISEASSAYDKEKLQERLARLLGGVAVIHVGATTETEMKEKKDRIDDALHAARAAVEEGIVPGGGSALIKVRNQMLLDYRYTTAMHPDEVTGMDIVYNAVSAPIKQIVTNAGGNSELVAITVEQDEDMRRGYNALTDSYVDMVEQGVVDPTKVIRTTLINAASIAGLMLTTECIIVENKENNKDTPPGSMMPMY